MLSGRYRDCEAAVVAMLRDMLNRRIEYSQRDGDRFFDAAQNARLVAAAERYYRVMYYGAVESWNLRDQHMFDTLERLLEFHGPGSKGIVWEHNSHVGNAAATEMGARGEHNVGQLSRARFAESAFLVGFGTDHGTVAAASDWDGPMEIKRVRPSHEASYERLCHDSEVKAFMLHLRDPARQAVRDELEAARLERAIGVSIDPNPNSRAIISRLACPDSSTSTSGSMKPARSRHFHRSSHQASRRHIRSASNSPRGRPQEKRHDRECQESIEQARLDARTTHLAQRHAIPMDRRFRRRSAGFALPRTEAEKVPG